MKKQVLIVACWGISALLTLTALVSARAQEETPFPPEATVVPKGAVFTAPGRCTVSPDESLIAVRDYGVFDLSSGEKRYEISGRTPKFRFSPDSRFLSIPQLGLFDAQTGQVLLESPIRDAEFSPDGRFYLDYEKVYALPSLEMVADLNREGDGINHYVWSRFINNGQWFEYALLEDALQAESPLSRSRQVIVDTATWQPVVDTNAYPSDVYLVFNADYTRYAFGGDGVFSYPDGKKLFDLPEGHPQFGNDSKIIMLRTFNATNQTVIYTFIDGETGAHLNQFNPNLQINTGMGNNFSPIANADLSQIAMPDFTIEGTGTQARYVLKGWRIIDIRTNTLIKQWVSDTMASASEEMGWPTPKYRYMDVQGRNLRDGVGVFDVATDTLIKPMDGLTGLYLTLGGSYAVSQNPCTVWSLP